MISCRVYVYGGSKDIQTRNYGQAIETSCYCSNCNEMSRDVKVTWTSIKVKKSNLFNLNIILRMSRIKLNYLHGLKRLLS